MPINAAEILKRSFLYKVSKNFYLTNHAHDRLKERNNELLGETLGETIGKLRTAINNCSYGHNNNDGSISVILHNGQTMIFSYDDSYKKWQFVTIKEVSANGYSPSDKRTIMRLNASVNQRKNKNHTRMTEREQFKEFKAKSSSKKPYKRSNDWRKEY